MIGRLVSGGQTGVDRAALDVALELGIPCGGWCPRGRRAEDGPIPDRYPLMETPSSDYRQRTRRNVRSSDATLILAWGDPRGGTLLTVQTCRRASKRFLVIDLADTEGLPAAAHRARAWLAEGPAGGVLNVAGPRGSKHPAAYERARDFLREVLAG
jgi:hypothetical protein